MMSPESNIGLRSNEKPITTPEMLLSSIENETARLYTEIATMLNASRGKNDKFEIIPEDEILLLAKEWIEDEEILPAINEGLYFTQEDPVVLLAIPNVDLSHEEIVDTWDFASHNGEDRKYRYREGNFWRDLKQWDSRSLCYFDPNLGPIRFVAIESGFDNSRVGPKLRDERNFDPQEVVFQLEELEKIRNNHPIVLPVDLFAGAVNACRWKHKDTIPNNLSDKTYTWDILLAPDDGGCIAGDGWIPTASITSGGKGDVSFVTGMHGRYSRRMVMNHDPFRCTNI